MVERNENGKQKKWHKTINLQYTYIFPFFSFSSMQQHSSVQFAIFLLKRRMFFIYVYTIFILFFIFNPQRQLTCRLVQLLSCLHHFAAVTYNFSFAPAALVQHYYPTNRVFICAQPFINALKQQQQISCFISFRSTASDY